MKTWLFALLEAAIAAAGLAAYFWADNVPLATAAAVLAAVLGVAHPIMAARKARKLARYQDGMYQKSIDAVDRQIDELLGEAIDLPLPHRPLVEIVLRRLDADRADALVAQYDRLVKAIKSHSFAAEELAAAFADKLADMAAPFPAATYLCGLAALGQGRVDEAHVHFTAATEENHRWISPWLAWAATAYQLQRFDEIRDHHPHVHGGDLAPYDVGDEETFIQLNEIDREALVEQFQATARSLGNFYTIAELCNSKTQIDQSRAEFRKAA